MGTSLNVRPFASLIDLANFNTPRLLINNEICGEANTESDGFEFSNPENHRDVFLKGDCDSGCLQFAKFTGLLDSLKAIIDPVDLIKFDQV